MKVYIDTNLSAIATAALSNAAVTAFDPDSYLIESSIPTYTYESGTFEAEPSRCENEYIRATGLKSTFAARLSRPEKKDGPTGTEIGALAATALVATGCNVKVGQIAACSTLIIAGLLLVRAATRNLRAPVQKKTGSPPDWPPNKSTGTYLTTRATAPSERAMDRSFAELFRGMILNKAPTVRIVTIRALSNALEHLQPDQYIPVVGIIARGLRDECEEVQLAAIKSLSDSSHLFRDLHLCGHLARAYCEIYDSSLTSERVRLAAIVALGKTISNIGFPNITFPNDQYPNAESNAIKALRIRYIVRGMWDSSEEVRKTASDTLLEKLNNTTNVSEANYYARAVFEEILHISGVKRGEGVTPDCGGLLSQSDGRMEVFKRAAGRLSKGDSIKHTTQLGDTLKSTRDVPTMEVILLLFRDALDPTDDNYAVPTKSRVEDIIKEHPDREVRELAEQVWKKILEKELENEFAW